MEFRYVCQTGFTQTSADKACKILKNDNTQTATSYGSYTCPTNGPTFWMMNVNCAGSEADLGSCTNAGWGQTTDCG